MKKRIVITGMGVVCAIGNDIASFTEGIREGRSGIRDIQPERFSTNYKVYRNNKACTIDQDYYEELYRQDDTILSEFSLNAIRQAIANAGLQWTPDLARRCGLSLGSSVGANFALIKWAKEYLQSEDALPNIKTSGIIAGNIARQLGLKGPLTTINTACAAGTNSIGRACDFLRAGRAELMIAGGVDVFTDHSFSGFNGLFAVSRNECRPFDQQRDGLILGDGAAFVVLEPYESAMARNATIYAEVLGYATLNEAYHATAPVPDGSMAYRVMTEAVAHSGLKPQDITYINAHGTATKANDEMEYKAIQRFANGNEVYVSSSKSMFGHTLGAAGSIELVATALGIYHNFIPPTINMHHPMQEPASDQLVFVKDKAIDKTYRYALSSSFGFAGNMAAIILEKANN